MTSRFKVKHPTDGEAEIQCHYPKAKHVKAGFSLYLEVERQSRVEEGDVTGTLSRYLELLDEMSSEGTGKTVEWLDELSDKDKNQITAWYDERVKRRADFMRPSDNQEN